MQVLTSRIDFAAFLARIRDAASRVLLLDYDGTLAPFHVRPELAVPYPQVVTALDEVVRAGGTRVVIVSGRPAEDLLPLVQLTKRPEVWGSHGWERLLPDGRCVMEEPSSDAKRALIEASAAIRKLMPAKARLERKLASIALHWRGLPDAEVAQLNEDAARLWTPLASGNMLELLPFDGGLELRAVGCNKQYAVKAVLSETPSDAAIAYLGDDITDEDAFRAVKSRGIGVLVRPEFRPTAADVWLKPPEELAEFVRHWCVVGRANP